MAEKMHIKNNTAEFLMFAVDSHENSVEVRYEDETLWLTQKMMAKLFGVAVPTINEHLKNVFAVKELEKDSVIRKFLITASDGKNYGTKHYNLDAIISVGYRVNSKAATNFRKWATGVLKEFAIKGFVMDDERLKNGTYLGKDYFDELLERVREIRASERRFYQKITDIYATALDYDPDNEITQQFFATVQNRLHFAITGSTAAELIKERANSKKKNMGLTNRKGSPEEKIVQSDTHIAKNYLSEDELNSLNRIVTMYLDYAENQAEKGIPMTMEDRANKLNKFLEFNEQEILENPGTVSAEAAKSFANSQWEEYRVLQDQEYESDFDRYLKE